MPKDYSRLQRVADAVRRDLAQIIQREMRDPRVGMIMVNDVEVSRDLAHAKVFVTVMGKESEEEAAEALKVLNDAAGFLRSQLARASTMRTTPRLGFVFDSSVLRGQQLSSLIDRAVSTDSQFHADSAASGDDTEGQDS
jgi:ribosome-binding factor A